MIDPKVQPLKLTIEVVYDAEVYEGDPEDAFEIAALEKGEIQESITNLIKSVIGEPKTFRITVLPD